MMRRATTAAFLPSSLAVATRGLVTPPSRKAVQLKDMRVDDGVRYPTVFNGLAYTSDIFGVAWTTADQRAVQERVWSRDCFLPTTPAAPLRGDFAVLSEIGAAQAVEQPDGSQGLLAKNELRATVKRRLVDREDTAQLHRRFLRELREFQAAPTAERAQLISDVAFWAQWLIRGVLFEGKLHGQQFTDAVVPAPLSTLAYAANAALGRHQLEFVYDDYTLKAATFPEQRPAGHHKHKDFEAVDYDDPADVLRYIADIDTPVGFCDMRGGRPEHNFRHNHSLMEQQMRQAFRGWRLMSDAKADGEAIVAGWREIATAAERAHKVFNTMMTNTPAASYPMIRLPIKGVRGACGNVYPPHGVFYEGCGADAFAFPENPDERASGVLGDSLTGPDAVQPGCYVDWEFGQTGANSSMYKWLDIFVGVTKQRHAYDLQPAHQQKLLRIVRGEDDPGTMGDNPIDSMQRAFDLLTRPALHLDELTRVARAVETGPYLDHAGDARLAANWELAAYERFRTAFYVASHRNVHGKYVLKMIYQTTPVGGQSRAEGTGGSTPPFLKTFFDQTFGPAMEISDALLTRGREGVLGAERLAAVQRMRAQLKREMQQMANVQRKGLELEADERRGKAGQPSSESKPSATAERA